MLNAIEPGSLMPIHRHQNSSETVVCLRGRLVEEFYDDLERMCTDAPRFFVTYVRRRIKAVVANR